MQAQQRRLARAGESPSKPCRDWGLGSERGGRVELGGKGSDGDRDGQIGHRRGQHWQCQYMPHPTPFPGLICQRTQTCTSQIAQSGASPGVRGQMLPHPEETCSTAQGKLCWIGLPLALIVSPGQEAGLAQVHSFAPPVQWNACLWHLKENESPGSYWLRKCKCCPLLIGRSVSFRKKNALHPRSPTVHKSSLNTHTLS